MIHFLNENEKLFIQADEGDLAPKHSSQLIFWGFKYDSINKRFVSTSSDNETIVPKLVAYFTRLGLPYTLDSVAQLTLVAHDKATSILHSAIEKGKRLKEGELSSEEISAFTHFLKHGVVRSLKPHQYKAALHLLCTLNGANFSVPGSGKTTVVLSVFQYLRELGKIDALFVVGPPACFGPWRDEYYLVLGENPKYEILAGGDLSDRRSKYLVNAKSACDLYLTTYQTLQRDWEQVRVLFKQQGVRFFLVVDEAHYIKQTDGAWANAVLNVARHAERRCVLTGTPFPRAYGDGFNLFDVLWPEKSPISSEDRNSIMLLSQQNQLEPAADILKKSIGPLFYRVRKQDLGLAPQIFHDPLCVEMNRYERTVYDAIIDRIKILSQKDYFQNLDILLRLRKGRMMRLRQCLSYTSLLATAVIEYSENLIGDNPSIADVIKHYYKLEQPAKITALLSLIQKLNAANEKVVIWSNFVHTLEYIRDTIDALGIDVRLIYGATPIHKNINMQEEQTREEIIKEFVDPAGSVRVLVANPAACAESISLHKTCSHAIYYDLSYNCAQYVQSLDRIHRVGGSENKPSHYYFLQYSKTIDGDILDNVQRKALNMSRVIDQDYPIYSLDMFAEDDESAAYERLFGANGKRI